MVFLNTKKIVLRRVIPTLLCTVTLTSCIKTSKTENIKTNTSTAFLPVVTSTEKNTYKENGSELTVCSYDSISLDETTAEIYPELQESLEALSRDIETSMTAAIAEVENTAKIDLEDGNLSESMYYTTTATILPERCDSKYLSIKIQYSIYTGGAHPIDTSWMCTYKVESGKEVTLADVINDKAKLMDRIKYQLLSDYGKADFYNLDVLKERYIDGEQALKWMLTEDGLRAHFDAYEIAPYNMGEFDVDIPFKGNEDIFVLSP